MIRPLRQRHRVIVLTLSVLLPAGFVLGIATRKAVPLAASLPSTLTGDAPRYGGVLWTREDLWQKSSIRTRLLADTSNNRLGVELEPREEIARPDMLVYWIPGEARNQDKLPDNAVLLGTLTVHPVRALALPPGAGRKTGALVLYSLADQEIVEASKPFTAK